MYMKHEDWVAYRHSEELWDRKLKIIAIILIAAMIIGFGIYVAYRINNPAPAKPASVMQNIGSTVTVEGVRYHATQFVTTGSGAKNVHFVVNTITHEVKAVWETGNTVFNKQQHSEPTGLLYNAE